MIKKILADFFAPLVAIIAALLALLARKAATDAKEELRRADEQREYEQAGSEAIVDALEREQEIRDEKPDPGPRDHFS